MARHHDGRREDAGVSEDGSTENVPPGRAPWMRKQTQTAILAKKNIKKTYYFWTIPFLLRIGKDDEFELWLNAVEDPNIKDEFERTPLSLSSTQQR